MEASEEVVADGCLGFVSSEVRLFVGVGRKVVEFDWRVEVSRGVGGCSWARAWLPGLGRVHQGWRGAEVDDQLVGGRPDRAAWVVVVVVGQFAEDVLVRDVWVPVEEGSQAAAVDMCVNRQPGQLDHRREEIDV